MGWIRRRDDERPRCLRADAALLLCRRERLNGLAAELAAGGRGGDLGETLWAGLDCGGFGSLDAGEELLHGKDQEEVDDAGDDEEVNDRREEVAVLDGRLSDGEDEIGEVRLTDGGGNKRCDDVFDERFGDGGEGGTDDDGDGQIDDVATEDEVAKAFDHSGSPWSEGRLPDSPLSIRLGVLGGEFFGGEILLGRTDPVGVGVEEEEEDHAESHEVHVDEENDAGVVEVPAPLHASDCVDGAGHCSQGREGQQHSGVVVREVGEQQGYPEADEDEDASTEKGWKARVEPGVSHTARNRVEGFDDECAVRGRARIEAQAKDRLEPGYGPGLRAMYMKNSDGRAGRRLLRQAGYLSELMALVGGVAGVSAGGILDTAAMGISMAPT
jgi:hypothetical protein